MNCFDVFIIVLVTVICNCSYIHIHYDHLVTTFKLSHIHLKQRIINYYLKLISLRNF